MSLVTLAGRPVLEATITLPLRGAWRADLVVASDGEDITGQVALEDNGLIYSGTVVRGGLDHTRWLGRLVGGAGGLTRPTIPRPYRDVVAAVVLADLLLDAGERLSPDSDPDVLTYALPQWLRFGQVEDALEALVVDKIGVNWRTERGGEIWVGTDTFPEVTLDHVIESRSDERRLWTIATERTDLAPGFSFEGQRIVQVSHRLSADSLRSEVSFGG
jgi:hypothetical protein